MSVREDVIALVAQLNAARDHLHTLEAELEGLLASANVEKVRAQPTPTRASRGGVSSRVIGLLQAEPSESFTVAEIATQLGITNLPALRQAISRLTQMGQIERRSRGQYVGVTKQRNGSPSRQPGSARNWLGRLFD